MHFCTVFLATTSYHRARNGGPGSKLQFKKSTSIFRTSVFNVKFSKPLKIILNLGLDPLLMVYAETLLSYPDCKIPFTVHTDASDEQLCAVTSQNNKLIAFFSRKLIKPQRNYATT